MKERRLRSGPRVPDIKLSGQHRRPSGRLCVESYYKQLACRSAGQRALSVQRRSLNSAALQPDVSRSQAMEFQCYQQVRCEWAPLCGGELDTDSYFTALSSARLQPPVKLKATYECAASSVPCRVCMCVCSRSLDPRGQVTVESREPARERSRS